MPILMFLFYVYAHQQHVSIVSTSLKWIITYTSVTASDTYSLHWTLLPEIINAAQVHSHSLLVHTLLSDSTQTV